MAYALYYIEANLVCIIIFALVLAREFSGGDRQELRRLFDKVLVAHIVFFANDCVWALIDVGIVLNNYVTQGCSNLMVFTLAEFIGYYWAMYADLLQGGAVASSKTSRRLVRIPFNIAFLVVLMSYLLGCGYWTDADGVSHNKVLYFALCVVPIVHVAASSVRACLKARQVRNDNDRRRLELVASYPLVLVASAVAQMAMIRVPILCFGTTVSMLSVYLYTLDSLVSLDPLTRLNNRNQFNRYVSQRAMDVASDERTFLLICDLDRFKQINDHYGHVTGDAALVRAANALRSACDVPTSCGPVFCARYGGDEFVAVCQVHEEAEVVALVERIQASFDEANAGADTAWSVATSVGYAELSGGTSGVTDALARADAQLYLDKAARRAQ